VVDLPLVIDIDPPPAAVAGDDGHAQVSAAEQLPLVQLGRVAGTAEDASFQIMPRHTALYYCMR